MYDSIKVNELQALHDHVLVADMNFGQRQTSAGVILLGDDMRTVGIRPRWAQVYAIGPKQKDIKVGEWVLVTHGRWTRGVKIEDGTGEKTVRRIDTNDILLVTAEEPIDDNMSGAVLSDAKDRW